MKSIIISLLCAIALSMITGYTGTSVVIDPDNDIAIILLINAVHPVDKYSVVRLRSLVANAVAGAIK